MATKSILKTIHIKNKKTVLSLVYALEHAAEKSSNDAKMSRSYSSASREEIRKMFGDCDEGVQNRKS